MPRLAEEVGLVGGQQIDRQLVLLRVALQQLEIGFEAGQPMLRHAARQPPGHQRLLGRPHGDAGHLVDPALEQGELGVAQDAAGGAGQGCGAGLTGRPPRARGIESGGAAVAVHGGHLLAGGTRGRRRHQVRASWAGASRKALSSSSDSVFAR
jgi:hypothetical protein